MSEWRGEREGHTRGKGRERGERERKREMGLAREGRGGEGTGRTILRGRGICRSERRRQR